MVTRRAECSCGQLSATCTGEPAGVSICHCLACKRRTGSAFSFNARWPEENVTFEGNASHFIRTGDEGGKADHRFCAVCGVTVYWTMDAMPGVVAIAAGAFADMTLPPPGRSVYHERAYPWLEIRAEPLTIID
jgi:hypothetical protein